MEENVTREKIEKFHKNEVRIRRLSVFVAIIPILIGTLWMYFSYKQVSKMKEQAAQFQTIMDKKQLEYQTLEFELQGLEEKKTKLEAELMQNYGLSIDSIQTLSTSEVLKTSLAANSAIKNLSEQYAPDKNIVVRYYNKTIDEERVALSLKSLGYRFQSKDPTSYMQKQQTNSIWFGREVPLKDCKIVALTLIRAGVPIKAIRPYNASITNPSYKSNIIEVGGDVAVRNKPVISVEEVKNAEKFERF